MLKFVGTRDGSAPITSNLLVGETTIANGDVCAWGSSGYVISANSGSCTTGLLVGIAEGSIAASAVTAGTTRLPFQTNPMATYRVDTLAAATQTDVGTNVGVSGGGGVTADEVDESTARTDDMGIFRVQKLITATGTSQTIEVTLNFASPSHV